MLSEIIAQGSKARAASYRFRHGYNALLEGGYLRETGVVQAICCQECDDPHDAQIVFEGGQYGFYCSDLGFVPLSRGQASAVTPDISCLVAALADSFVTKRRKTSPLHGETWRIGAVETAGGNVSIYFHPRLDGEQDLGDLRSALAGEVKSPFRLVLTASGGLKFEDATAARLADVVEVDSETGTLTTTVDPGTIVGAPARRAGGRPNQFGEALAGIIRSRIESGTALQGRNEEAKAILEVLRLAAPNSTPSLSLIKSYLTNIRSG